MRLGYSSEWHNTHFIGPLTVQYAVKALVKYRSHMRREILHNALFLLRRCMSVCGVQVHEWPQSLVLGVRCHGLSYYMTGTVHAGCRLLLLLNVLWGSLHGIPFPNKVGKVYRFTRVHENKFLKRLTTSRQLTFIHVKLCLTDLRLTSVTISGVCVCVDWMTTISTTCGQAHGRLTGFYTRTFSESMGRHAWIPDNNEWVYSFHGCYA